MTSLPRGSITLMATQACSPAENGKDAVPLNFSILFRRGFFSSPISFLLSKTAREKMICVKLCEEHQRRHLIFILWYGNENNLDFLCGICYHIYCKHILFILNGRIGRNPHRKKHEITSQCILKSRSNMSIRESRFRQTKCYTFYPIIIFFHQKNRHRKRLRNQTPRGFIRTNKKHAMLHQCNIFRHPHQQNASRQTVAKKNGNHVTFPRHTWILHVTVTLQTSQ